MTDVNTAANPFEDLLNTDTGDDELASQLKNALSQVLTENAGMHETVTTQNEQLHQIATNELQRILHTIGQDTLKPDLVLQNMETGAITEENVKSALDGMGIKYSTPETVQAAQTQQTLPQAAATGPQFQGYAQPQGPPPVVAPPYARIQPPPIPAPAAPPAAPQPAQQNVQPLQQTTQLQADISGMVHHNPSATLMDQVNAADTPDALRAVLTNNGLLAPKEAIF